MINAPCKDCNFRHLGCHSSCVSYIDWKQQRAVEKEKADEQRKCDYDAIKRWRRRH